MAFTKTNHGIPDTVTGPSGQHTYPTILCITWYIVCVVICFVYPVLWHDINTSTRVGIASVRVSAALPDTKLSHIIIVQFNSIQFSLFPAHINISYNNNNVHIVQEKGRTEGSAYERQL